MADSSFTSRLKRPLNKQFIFSFPLSLFPTQPSLPPSTPPYLPSLSSYFPFSSNHYAFKIFSAQFLSLSETQSRFPLILAYAALLLLSPRHLSLPPSLYSYLPFLTCHHAFNILSTLFLSNPLTFSSLSFFPMQHSSSQSFTSPFFFFSLSRRSFLPYSVIMHLKAFPFDIFLFHPQHICLTLYPQQLFSSSSSSSNLPSRPVSFLILSLCISDPVQFSFSSTNPIT